MRQVNGSVPDDIYSYLVKRAAERQLEEGKVVSISRLVSEMIIATAKKEMNGNGALTKDTNKDIDHSLNGNSVPAKDTNKDIEQDSEQVDKVKDSEQVDNEVPSEEDRVAKAAKDYFADLNF
jgi:hypothetical protein